MKVRVFLREALVLPDIQSRDKEGALSELSGLIASQVAGLTGEKVLDALLAREKLGSTGIEDGVAIPHAKIPGLGSIVLAVGRSTAGIEFQSIDHHLTTLLFLLLAPDGSTGDHLKVLARLSRLLKDDGFRKQLLAAHGRAEMYRTILEFDEKF